MLSFVRLFATLWTLAHQDPLSMQPARLCPWDFPVKSTGTSFHFLLQGNPPNLGFKPMSLVPLTLHYITFFTTEPLEKPHSGINTLLINFGEGCTNKFRMQISQYLLPRVSKKECFLQRALYSIIRTLNYVLQQIVNKKSSCLVNTDFFFSLKLRTKTAFCFLFIFTTPLQHMSFALFKQF